MKKTNLFPSRAERWPTVELNMANQESLVCRLNAQCGLWEITLDNHNMALNKNVLSSLGLSSHPIIALSCGTGSLPKSLSFCLGQALLPLLPLLKALNWTLYDSSLSFSKYNHSQGCKDQNIPTPFNLYKNTPYIIEQVAWKSLAVRLQCGSTYIYSNRHYETHLIERGVSILNFWLWHGMLGTICTRCSSGLYTAAR